MRGMLAGLVLVGLLTGLYAQENAMGKRVLVLVGSKGAEKGGVDGLSGASKSTAEGIHAGTTAEFGRIIRDVLQRQGCEVTLKLVSAQGPSPKGYDLVVLGTGMYGGQIHPQMKAYKQAFGSALATLPHAVFVVCARMGAPGAKTREQVTRVYGKRISEGLAPKTVGVFGGLVPESGMIANFMMKTLMGGLLPGDYRDRKAVEKWATALVQEH
jgi:menaquinone-dependent protoporphyrinogen IX oxidase